MKNPHKTTKVLFKSRSVGDHASNVRVYCFYPFDLWMFSTGLKWGLFGTIMLAAFFSMNLVYNVAFLFNNAGRSVLNERCM